MISIKRYKIKNTCLIPYVKFIWHFESSEQNIYHKLLPTDSIDLIINLSSDILYETNSVDVLATPLHINGLRSKHSYIYQKVPINIWGISFYCFGLYPFVHQSLENTKDKIVDLHDISYSLASKLENTIILGIENELIQEKIENILCEELKIKNSYAEKIHSLHSFFNTDKMTIQEFCLKNHIIPKTFTRNVLSYTGYRPTELRAIMRFQNAGNQLIFQQQDSFAEIAYCNHFSDQSHFIREFKKFSGVSPSVFLKEKITVKENSKYFYE